MKATLERLYERRERLQKGREEGDEGGFTLIELLIVIVILGILAAIVVLAVGGLSGSSAQASCKTDYRTVETAVTAYYAQMDAYPANVAALLTTATDPSGVTVGPWLNDNPDNPGHYVIDTNGSGGIVVYAYSATATNNEGAVLGTNEINACNSVS